MPQGPVPMTTGRSAQPLRCLRHHAVAHVRRSGDMRDVLLEQRRFVLYLHIHGIDQHDGIPFARVIAAPEQGVVQQIGCGDTQPLEYRGLEIVLLDGRAGVGFR